MSIAFDEKCAINVQIDVVGRKFVVVFANDDNNNDNAKDVNIFCYNYNEIRFNVMFYSGGGAVATLKYLSPNWISTLKKLNVKKSNEKKSDAKKGKNSSSVSPTKVEPVKEKSSTAAPVWVNRFGVGQGYNKGLGTPGSAGSSSKIPASSDGSKIRPSSDGSKVRARPVSKVRYKN